MTSDEVRHNARLDLELHVETLERALGRGGAPVDLPRARAEIAPVREALAAIEALVVDAAPS